MTIERGWATFRLASAIALGVAWGCGETQLGASSCRVGEALYADGTSFSPDGCNQCRCEQGRAQCILLTCKKACGGTHAGSCGEGEYCAHGAGCGTPDASARCATRPAACSDVYEPVCGCDGQTYPNACEAKRSGTGSLHDGACKRALNPKCRVGDVLYPEGSTGIPAPDGCNTCRCVEGQLACTTQVCCGGASGDPCSESQYCAYDVGTCATPGAVGRCQARPATCDDVSAPVCGCDGASYVNACEAARAGVDAAQPGSCPERRSCSLGGETYPDGATGIQLPGDCNRCSCHDGALSCTALPC
jgi:hypothetical protein